MLFSDVTYDAWATRSGLLPKAFYSYNDHMARALKNENPGAPVNSSLGDLLAYAAANPGTPNYLTPATTWRTVVDISGSVVFTVPPEAQAGDWMVAVITPIDISHTFTSPDGTWTPVTGIVALDTGSRRSYAWTRMLVAGETTFTFPIGGGNQATKGVLMGGSGVSGFQVGAVTTRAASGGASQNKAASIVTTTPNVRSLCISMEATALTEGAVSSIVGATEWFYAGESGSSINTISASFVDKAVPGATGDVLINYVNPQGLNGWAIQIGLIPINSRIYTIATMPTPWQIAHRGLSLTYPEMSQFAYDSARRKGMPAIEISVWKSSSGTFWCTHDQNLLRETGNNVSIDVTADATLATYNVLGSLTDKATQPNRAFSKLVDILNLYAATSVIFIEDKTYANQAALVTIMNGYPQPTEHFVWKQFGVGTKFAGAAAAGYKCWGYFFDADMSNFNANQAQWDYVGLDYNSSDVTLNAAIATAGASRVIAHIIPDTTQKTRMLAKGVKGLMESRLAVYQG